ncbi:MAG: molybdopterin molybdotransferase MoeA [Acidobacteriaceae bacterium]
MSAPVVTYPEAALLVLEHARALRDAADLKRERADLPAAQGRVLAEAIHAERDQPPFDRSTRDGYAGRAEDLMGRQWLPVAGSLRAGSPQAVSPLPPGQVLEIMTGAPAPAQADCVAMLEHVERREEDGAIRLQAGRAVRAGQNIVGRGSEARRGAVVLEAGLRLEPQHIAAAAACGAADVDVYTRPRVAILPTGDELVELNAPMEPYQIRNSNSYSLAAQVRSAGGDARRLPVARDERAHVRAMIERAIEDADMLLLSGGVSAGKYDLVEETLLSMGAEFVFTGVAMQPGKPVVFGHVPAGSGGRRIPLFGLPGNPVSTMVTFLLFAAPMMRALGGEIAIEAKFAQARLLRELATQTGLTRFLPARLSGGWEGAAVERIAWQGSGDLAATARANCFVVIPPDVTELSTGATVSVLLA